MLVRGIQGSRSIQGEGVRVTLTNQLKLAWDIQGSGKSHRIYGVLIRGLGLGVGDQGFQSK